MARILPHHQGRDANEQKFSETAEHSGEALIKVGMPHHYFRHGCVRTSRGNLANLRRIRDFPRAVLPCPDENILLIRASLVNPRFQLKFSFHFIVTGLVIFGVVIVLINERLMRVSNIMASGELMDFEHSIEFNDLMLQILSFSLFGFVAFIIFSFTFALIISHRIAGQAVTSWTVPTGSIQT